MLSAAWTYDQNGQKGVLNAVEGTADGFRREYRYDSLLRPYKVVTRVPASDAVLPAGSTRTFVVEHGYDRNHGRKKAMRYPGGEAVAFDYTALGYLLGETEWLATGAFGKQYRRVKAMSPRGQVTEEVLGNCVTEATHYDDSAGMAVFLTALRPSGMTVLPQDILTCPLGTGLIRQATYAHDQFLNLETQKKNIAGVEATEAFSYDELQRLTGAARSWGTTPPPGYAAGYAETDSYAYDDLGNILWKSDYGTSYAYGSSARSTRNAGPHAVVSVLKRDGATATFGYDLNGNLLDGDGRRIDFDLMDRAVRVCSGTSGQCAPGAVPPGPTSEFSYAPDGARYRQVVTGSVDPSFGPKTVYSVDKDYELTVWADGTTEERSYLSGSAVVYRKGIEQTPERANSLPRCDSAARASLTAVRSHR